MARTPRVLQDIQMLARVGGMAILAVFAAGCGRSGPLLDEESPWPGRSPTATQSTTATPTPAPTPVVLLDVKFDAGSGGLTGATGVTWADTTGGGFEVYDSGGAGARGMSASYDHDGNLATAEVAIPGAVEVNDNGNDVRLTATLTLPILEAGDAYTGGGVMTFWAGMRGAPVGPQTIEVFDTTDGVTLTGALQASLPSGATPRPWVFNSMNVPFSGAQPGDTIAVRFQSSGNGAEGLQIAWFSLIAAVE